MKKRILSFVIVLIMTLGFLPTVSFAANTTEFAGGSGTESDPYLISTKTHLNNVRNYLSAHFQMTNNIEFTTADFELNGSFYNNGKFFVPIGSSESQFIGTFDGNGYVIKNLKINYTKTTNVQVGLFAYNSGCIKNLGIVNGNIEVKANAAIYLGAIAGTNAGTISNCYNASKLRGTSVGYKSNSTVGGIVGYNKGIVEKCYNTGKPLMIAGFYLGGIVGTVAGGMVTNCYNIGEVYTTAVESKVGGIVGYLSDGTVSDCYNVGEIGYEARVVLGGIVGLSNGTVIRCYDESYIHNAAEINDITCGAIIGKTKDKSEILDCYYLNWMGGFGQSPDGATRIAWNQEGEQSTYLNFDFENVWMFDKSVQKTPMLRAFHTHTFDDVCDADCNSCGETRNAPHKFDNACDTICDCGYERIITHNYKVVFDANNHFDMCTGCGDTINVNPHVFDNACDTTCDCGYVRTTTHSFGGYVYNGDASEKADGTKTRTCSVCGHKEIVTATGTKWKSSFTDIKAKDFYYKPTLWAVANGITTGTSKTEFSPQEPCTRGQVVTFLWRAAGCPEPKSNTMPFTDVGSKAFYRKAVLWAVEQGITSGTSATTFSPNETCTRGQIATFLWRAKGKPAPKSSNMPFVDVKLKDFYYKAVQWAVENKITSGTTKTTFAPSEPCTRGQIVTFLYRAYK